MQVAHRTEQAEDVGRSTIVPARITKSYWWRPGRCRRGRCEVRDAPARDDVEQAHPAAVVEADPVEVTDFAPPLATLSKKIDAVPPVVANVTVVLPALGLDGGDGLLDPGDDRVLVAAGGERGVQPGQGSDRLPEASLKLTTLAW